MYMLFMRPRPSIFSIDVGRLAVLQVALFDAAAQARRWTEIFPEIGRHAAERGALEALAARFANFVRLELSNDEVELLHDALEAVSSEHPNAAIAQEMLADWFEDN